MSKFNYKICSRHDIAEILLKLALNTNQFLCLVKNVFYLSARVLSF